MEGAVGYCELVHVGVDGNFIATVSGRVAFRLCLGCTVRRVVHYGHGSSLNDEA